MIILVILAPITFPKAKEGLGGDNNTAEILAESSGNEVAKATKILPTNSLPKPVIEAITSPYFAKYVPNIMVDKALIKKMIIFTIKVSNLIAPYHCPVLTNK